MEQILMAAAIVWGIEISGDRWGSGGSSYGVFATQAECEEAANSLLERTPAATKVSCIKISGPGNGDGEVIDRISFGRGKIIIEWHP